MNQYETKKVLVVQCTYQMAMKYECIQNTPTVCVYCLNFVRTHYITIRNFQTPENNQGDLHFKIEIQRIKYDFYEKKMNLKLMNSLEFMCLNNILQQPNI